MRVVVFLGLGYLALLVETALGLVLPSPRPLFAAPELALFVVLYLGLSGRGGPVGLTASALTIGYLRDLLLGAPRGVEALAFAVVALAARALHGRVFLDRFGQLASVAVAFSLGHALFVMALAGDTSMRSIPGLLVGAAIAGPIALRSLRRLDERFSTETRSVILPGLGGGWR